MKRAQTLLLLLALALALALSMAGCGGNADSGVIGAAAGVGDATDGAAGTDGADGAADAAAGTDGYHVGERLARHPFLLVYLNSLEIGEDEGTAVLGLESTAEDVTITFGMSTVWIDGREGECRMDGDEVSLPAGEMMEVTVHFSCPDSSKSLADSAYIMLNPYTFGLYNDEEIHLVLYVKGDKDIAEEIMNQNSAAAAAELELYNEHGVIVTLTEIETGIPLAQSVPDGSVIILEITNNISLPIVPQVKELSIGDLSLNDPGDIGAPLFTISVGATNDYEIKIYNEEANRLIREQEAEFSIVFTFRVEGDDPIIETPKITFPSVMK